ncbi:hypothetical protein [Motilibacter aurantiacus]|uniref:hypothetical protein n=1 Tax=Motilibacter aurantiacus TaxID=2714955 RepID=UPI001407A7D8|nr:hypothetical protein [Motilibacter aurantiacus]NHC45634.1 hypothetical protein [Motilibacter aurantiacus]
MSRAAGQTDTPDATDRGRPRLGRRVVGAGTALTLVVGAGGVYAYSALAAGGPQPEAVLPAGAIAYAKVDLDPTAAQKIAAMRLARKADMLRSAAPGGLDGVKETTISAVAEESGLGLSEADISAWAGDRAAYAVYAAPPTVQDEDGVDVVVAIATTNNPAARVALDKVKAAEGTAYTIKGGFVLLSEDQPSLDRVLALPGALGKDRQVTADLDALNSGDRVAEMWVDLDAVLETETAGTAMTSLVARAGLEGSAGEAARAALTPAVRGGTRLSGETATSLVRRAAAGGELPRRYGRMVGAIHLNASYIEVKTRMLGVPVSGIGTAGSDLIRALPSGIYGAFGITGYGASLADAWATLPPAQKRELRAVGIGSAADFRALAGRDLAIAVGRGSSEQVSGELRVRSSTPDRTRALWQRLVTEAEAGEDVSVRRDGDVVTVAVGTLQANRSLLAYSPVYQQAVPDASRSGYTLFVDLARAFEAADVDTGLWRGLQAAGVTMQEDGTMRVRLTVR